MNRSRLRCLAEALDPAPPRVLGVTVADGEIRTVLMNNGVTGPPPPGLTLAELSGDCLVYHYDPANECATLYKSTADGRAHVQSVVGVDEDVVCGRKPWQPERASMRTSLPDVPMRMAGNRVPAQGTSLV
jgi:hypothetical protein